MSKPRRNFAMRAVATMATTVAFFQYFPSPARAGDGIDAVDIGTAPDSAQSATINATSPSGNGGSATATASDPTTGVASASGGNGLGGGNGGFGSATGTGETISAQGGTGGSGETQGGAGGDAIAVSAPDPSGVYSPFVTVQATGGNGQSGGGTAGENGFNSDGNGGNGGNVSAQGFAQGNATSDGASLQVTVTGGGGGGGIGGSGGNGGQIGFFNGSSDPVSAFASSDYGGPVSATLTATGGSGAGPAFGPDNSYGIASPGGDVVLNNAVGGYSSDDFDSVLPGGPAGFPAGSVNLTESATGGIGADSPTNASKGGGATANLTVAIPSSHAPDEPSLIVSTAGEGGSGGEGGISGTEFSGLAGNGGDGGDGVAYTNLSAPSTTLNASANAQGGEAGSASSEGGNGGNGGTATATAMASVERAGTSATADATAEGGIGHGTSSGLSGSGGDATASATAVSDGLSTANATAAAGRGGNALGTGVIGGTGGNASATAEADTIAGSAVAVASATGGAGGFGENTPDGIGGIGGSADAVAIGSGMRVEQMSPGADPVGRLAGLGGYAHVSIGVLGLSFGSGNDNEGTLSLTGAGSLSTVAGTGITGNGTLVIGDGVNATIFQLAMNSGGSSLSSLTINSGSALDITNNHLIINYAPGTQATVDAAIRSYLIAGRNGGAWNGTGGINSSVAALPANSHYALGYADGADGIVAGLSSGQIEIKYTLLGDADLDGAVTGSDFTALVGNLGKSGRTWDQGDFDYDGSVTGSDFTALVGNLGKSASGADIALPAADYAAIDAFAAANGLMADVPEPTSAGVLFTFGLAILAQRVRNRVCVFRPDAPTT
jgi:hypothetical protein